MTPERGVSANGESSIGGLDAPRPLQIGRAADESGPSIRLAASTLGLTGSGDQSDGPDLNGECERLDILLGVVLDDMNPVVVGVEYGGR